MRFLSEVCDGRLGKELDAELDWLGNWSCDCKTVDLRP